MESRVYKNGNRKELVWEKKNPGSNDGSLIKYNWNIWRELERQFI